jgi:hypothetical protein
LGNVEGYRWLSFRDSKRSDDRGYAGRGVKSPTKVPIKCATKFRSSTDSFLCPLIPLPSRVDTVRDPNHACALPPFFVSFVSFVSFVVGVGTNRLSLTSAAMVGDPKRRGSAALQNAKRPSVALGRPQVLDCDGPLALFGGTRPASIRVQGCSLVVDVDRKRTLDSRHSGRTMTSGLASVVLYRFGSLKTHHGSIFRPENRLILFPQRFP